MIHKIKKVIMAIPYIIKCVQIVNVMRTKMDINGDGKISIDELKEFIDGMEYVKTPPQGE